jgi:hypothetical protein
MNDDDRTVIRPGTACLQRGHPQAEVLTSTGEHGTVCQVCTLIHRRGGDAAVAEARADLLAEATWLRGTP